MRKWLVRSVSAIAGLLVLAIIFFMTPPGLRSGLKIISAFLPGQLSFTKVSGSVFGPINIENLTYSSKPLHLRIAKAHVAWRLPSLLYRKINIIELTVDNARIIYQPTPATSAKKPQPLHLAFGIKIEKGNLNHVLIASPNASQTIFFRNISFDKFNLGRHFFRGSLAFNLRRPDQIQGSIALDGSLAHYQINVALTKGKDHFSAVIQGTPNEFNLNLPSQQLLGGSLQGQAGLTWYPELKWNSHINVQSINLRKVDPRLPIINRAEILTQGDWHLAKPRLTVNTSINLPHTVITINGQRSELWNVGWKIQSKDINDFFPDARGTLSLQGTLTGDQPQPNITANFSASNLLLQDKQLASLKGSLAFDLNWKRASSIDITGRSLSTPALQANQFTLKAHSTDNFNTIEAQATLDNDDYGRLSLSSLLSGQVKNASWQGHLQRFTFSAPQVGTWTLVQAYPLSISKQVFDLPSACWGSNWGKLCFALHTDRNTWHARVSGNLKHITPLIYFLNPNLVVSAPITFSGSAAGQDNMLSSFNSEFHVKSGTISFENNGQDFTVPLKEAYVSSSTKNNDLITKANIMLSSSDYLKFNLNFPNIMNNIANLPKQKVNGTINIHSSRIKLLQIFIPQISQPTGYIDGRLNIDGNLLLPDVRGKITFKNGQIEVPELKLQLTDINMNVFARDKKINYEVKVKSAANSLMLHGFTELKNHAYQTEFQLKGNHVLISNTPEYSIYASPDLTIKLANRALMISGSVLIPQALLKPVDLSSTDELPDDAVIIDSHNQTSSSPWKYLINAKVKLGNNVYIDAHSLKGQLVGGLDISQTTKLPNPIANGTVTIKNGTFTAQGQTLKLSHQSGVKYINDPINNPHLNIRAYRTVSAVDTRSLSPVGPTKTTVGIEYKGTLQKPKISLFSTPVTLTQANILSYLLLNQPAGTGSSVQYNLLIQALSSLKFSGNSELSTVSRIKQSLGITQLGVQSQTYVDALGTPLGINQSSFVIGSYLTPRLYIQYSHALLTPVDFYVVRYLFNKHWSVQTETSSSSVYGSGIDILYTTSKKQLPW